MASRLGSGEGRRLSRHTASAWQMMVMLPERSICVNDVFHAVREHTYRTSIVDGEFVSPIGEDEYA